MSGLDRNRIPETGAGICYLFCFDRGTVSGITIIRPIALILPKLQMAQLPHYVPLIDGSIEQPAQETVKKLSCQSRVDPIPYLPAKKWESHPSKEKTEAELQFSSSIMQDSCR